MISPEIQAAIRMEVRKQINVLLPGVSANTTATTEDIANIYPGYGNVLPASPTVRPYGFVSNTPEGTSQIVGRVGDNEGSRVVLGHRDANPPLPPNPGESAIYSLDGYELRVRNALIEVGKDGVFQPAVMGDNLVNFLTTLLAAITSATYGGYPLDNPLPFDIPTTDLLCKDGGAF